jgi:uncharacterized repeat protein (TIGR03847 family)
MTIELDPVDRITADAVGAPGERAFYLQARKGELLITLTVEKQQVQLLAASIVEILSRIGKETGQGPGEEAMGLEEPVVPVWRAGRLTIGYLPDRDLILLEAEEILPDEAVAETEEDEEIAPELADELGLGTFAPTEEPDGGTEEGEDDAEEGAELTDEEAEEQRRLEGLEDIEDLEALEELSALGTEEIMGDEERGKVRFWATREQMLSLARHGASVCAAGRPRCQLCGNPIDPEGHECPALNGHRKLGQG